MYHLGLVALGGGIGAGCRHLVNFAALRLFGPGLPLGTLTVNVVGGLLMGVVVGYFAHKHQGGGEGLRLFLATGILGGFTTFSAFSLEVVLFWEKGQFTCAVAYVLASVVLSVAAVMAGVALVRTFA